VSIAHDLLVAAQSSSAEAGDDRNWLGLFSLVIGGYGAVVATWVAVSNWRRDRPGVEVQLIGDIQIAKPENELFWQIRVVNLRKRPITIETIGLVDSDGLLIAARAVDEDGEPTAAPVPTTLEDGDYVVLRTRRDPALDVVGAYAMDPRLKTYTGKMAKRVWRWSPQQIEARRLAKKQASRYRA
jgi:hypothetical protein